MITKYNMIVISEWRGIFSNNYFYFCNWISCNRYIYFYKKSTFCRTTWETKHIVKEDFTTSKMNETFLNELSFFTSVINNSKL